MLFSRKLLVVLLAVAVVGADKRNKLWGTVKFCMEGGQCAGELWACYDIKDGLFNQKLGIFNDKITDFKLFHTNYYCNVFE